MNKITSVLKFGILLPSLLLLACNRNDKELAGKGGNGSFELVPKHHEVYTNLINAKAYIKYNASDIPASYDDSAVCVMASGMPTATFSGLKKGKYYLMAKAYDTSIKQNVTGGIPFEITTETAYKLSIPVTEGD